MATPTPQPENRCFYVEPRGPRLRGGWAAVLFGASLAAWAVAQADEPRAGDQPQARPRTSARRPVAPATQPAAQPGRPRVGVVQAALTELYVRPRVPARTFNHETRVLNRPPGTQPAISVQPPGDNHGRVPPHPQLSRDHRLGLQHLDAIRDSASASVPIGDDIHGAQADPGSAPTAPPGTEHPGVSGDTYVFLTPPVGYGYPLSPRLTQRERDWANYRYFGGRPSRYGYGRFDRYGGYGADGGDAFRYGFMRGYDVGYFDQTSNARTRSLLAYARSQLNRGIELFAQGRYEEAADAFQASADSDQGDAITRIYAGHALFALGRYRDAVAHIRRAVELQPRIVHLRFDMRGDYERVVDFDAQLNALKESLELAPTDPDRLFLLGYVLYFSGQRTAAYPVLSRAHALDRGDELVARMMRSAQPADVEVDAMKANTPGSHR